ncbi:MAG: hypothetical protein F6K36_22105 [Symploca sp. SIO3C6]|nr:hypothetical protein [Symploca sp. SIO3C6]
MAGTIEKLESGGVLNPGLTKKLSDDQRQVLDNLSDSEVQTLVELKKKIKPTGLAQAKGAVEEGGGLYF